MTNVFYIAHFNVIGGIETYVYELAKKYGKYDIVVYYNEGDAEQIKRLRQCVEVRKLGKEIVKCKKLFVMYRCNLSMFEADEVIQIIHADYKAQGLRPNLDERINAYYGVSKSVAKAYEEISGAKVGVCYNPITEEKPKRVLKLISATRLTKEKGKDRMIKLATALDKAGIPYIWLVFTNDYKEIPNKNVVYMEPRLDIKKFIAGADYLVQLSDTEAWSYSAIESLTLGIPVIVTKIPSFIEMGIENGVNGYVLDFDMKNIPIDDIYNKIPKFKFKAPEDIYDQLLIKEPSKYKPNELVKVKVLRSYDDVELGKRVNKNTELELEKPRAEWLKDKGLVVYV